MHLFFNNKKMINNISEKRIVTYFTLILILYRHIVQPYLLEYTYTRRNSERMEGIKRPHDSHCSVCFDSTQATSTEVTHRNVIHFTEPGWKWFPWQPLPLIPHSPSFKSTVGV